MKEYNLKGFSFTQTLYIKAIEKYKKENYGEIPTMRKIAKLVGVNCPSSVHSMLKRLKEKGYDYKDGKRNSD